jgi:hypothetical protein
MQKENEGAVAVLFTDKYGDASINVVVEETRATLSEYVASSKQSLASTLDNYHLKSEFSRVIGGLDCYELIATWTLQNVTLRMWQVVFVENGKAFIITCETPNSRYFNHTTEFENAILSFRITSQANGLGLIVGVAFVAAVAIAIVAIFFLRRKKPESTIESDSTLPPPPPQPKPSRLPKLRPRHRLAYVAG